MFQRKPAKFSPTDFIQKGWPKIKWLPLGNRIFSTILSKYIPYTGSIKPLVHKIEGGYALVSLKDRPAIRNHLESIHALAIANLGELSTGLAMTSQLPTDVKAILIKLETNYFKKARGRLTAEAHFQLPHTMHSEDEWTISASIKDAGGYEVARVNAVWKIRL